MPSRPTGERTDLTAQRASPQRPRGQARAVLIAGLDTRALIAPHPSALSVAIPRLRALGFSSSRTPSGLIAAACRPVWPRASASTGGSCPHEAIAARSSPPPTRNGGRRVGPSRLIAESGALYLPLDRDPAAGRRRRLTAPQAATRAPRHGRGTSGRSLWRHRPRQQRGGADDWPAARRWRRFCLRPGRAGRARRPPPDGLLVGTTRPSLGRAPRRSRLRQTVKSNHRAPPRRTRNFSHW
jgi:hypothetical protein